MQDMKTGEGGLLQVTLEGINLKFMHNQVGTSGGSRLLSQRGSGPGPGAPREPEGRRESQTEQREGTVTLARHQAPEGTSGTRGRSQESEARWPCCCPLDSAV